MLRAIFSKLTSQILLIPTVIALYWLTTINNTPIFNKQQEQLLSQGMLPENQRALAKTSEERIKIDIGEQLFNDTRLSKNNDIACVTCHNPDDNFHDLDNVTADVTGRDVKAPSLRGVHEQSWFFWDGRADSLWSQSLEAIRNEHGLSPQETVSRVCEFYGSQNHNELAFCHSNDSEEQKYKKIGDLIARYIATIDHSWSRFDEYVYQYLINDHKGNTLLSYDEIEGLKLFLDRKKTGCIDCHSGSRFSNDGFYAIGTGVNSDSDRISGIEKYLSSEYSCQKWNDETDCIEYIYMRKEGEDLAGAFKVPSLRNIYKANSFMHDRRFATLEEVLHYYMYPTGYMYNYVDVKPLRMSSNQRKQLIAFLNTLNEPYYLLEVQ
ncbi:cytochrome-c peroxidase [Enterovibrio coralii]|uniref:Cytochrome c domain-containing protein n=1 Tax=Enterovibrio coralii TaxID=294935 RepID=A0A135I6G2_9GAMM|nr:cytochrome c peroxidase [Enterovibrio coralii]KXF80974.1 hypothetical protein ATN88_18170 [Enterovibrio coralii]